MARRVKTADQQAAEFAARMFKGGSPMGEDAPEGKLTADAGDKPLSDETDEGDEDEKAAESKTADAAAKSGRAPRSLRKNDDKDADDKGGDSDPEEDEGDEDGEGEDEGEDGGEGEDEDEPQGDAKLSKRARKSAAPVVGIEALTKAMDALEAAAVGVDQGAVDRRLELSEKLAAGTLQKSERDELLALLAEPEATEPLIKSATDTLLGDASLQRDYEVSDFLRQQAQLMAGAVDALSDRLGKSIDDQGAFNRALAKSFRAIGEVVSSQQDLIKAQQQALGALSQRLGTVEATPLPRRGISGTRALAKSFADQGSAGTQLGHGSVLMGLDRLMQKSMAMGRSGMSASGIDLATATAQYEMTQQLPPALAAEISAELGATH